MVAIARWKASPGPRRDFVGYGRTPPDIRWTGGAAVAANLVLNHDLAVFTRAARFELELDPKFTLRGKTGDGRETAGWSRGAPFGASLADFLDHVRHTPARPVFCTPADATHSLAVALVCERALASGGSAAVRPRSTQRAEALQ